jgi:hypothetical protein
MFSALQDVFKADVRQWMQTRDKAAMKREAEVEVLQ